MSTKKKMEGEKKLLVTRILLIKKSLSWHLLCSCCYLWLRLENCSIQRSKVNGARELRDIFESSSFRVTMHCSKKQEDRNGRDKENLPRRSCGKGLAAAVALLLMIICAMVSSRTTRTLLCCPPNIMVLWQRRPKKNDSTKKRWFEALQH